MERLLNTWKCKSPRSPPWASPLPHQTPPCSSWQNTWESSMFGHDPGSVLGPWQQGVESGTPQWGGWRGTPSPGPAAAPPPSPPLQTATTCQESGKRSRSWQTAGEPGWKQQRCTCCTLLVSRTPCCTGQPSVCRSSRVPMSWNRRWTGWSTLCPGPSSPCVDYRLGQSIGSVCLQHTENRDGETGQDSATVIVNLHKKYRMSECYFYIYLDHVLLRSAVVIDVNLMQYWDGLFTNQLVLKDRH